MEDPGVDGGNVKIYIQDWVRRHGLDGSGSGHGQVAGACKSGNDPSGSIKCG